MKRKKQIPRFVCGVLAAGLLVQALPAGCITAYAGTPEFGRSAEEWAKLRDNKIEYDELADLVHEYNATVVKNQIDLAWFKNDYGMSNDEWSSRYRELADDLESSLDYPDVEDSGYATTMTNIVTSEMQIKSWREKADDAEDDYLTYYYDYSSAEALIASTAQTDMIQYYQYQLQKQSDELALELQEENWNQVQSKRQHGSATDVDVLTAEESLRNAKKAVQDDENSIDRTRERLVVLLGWKHDDHPEIGELPEVTQEMIDALNPDADREVAVENNYTLKINRRKLEISKSGESKEKLQEAIDENIRSIGASLSSAYQDVVSARAARDLAAAKAQLANDQFAIAQRQYQVGSLSRYGWLTQKNSMESAAIEKQAKELELLQAVESYHWAVKGLAGSSS